MSADLTIAIVGAIFTAAAFLVGVAQTWIAVYPVLQETRHRKILNEKFSIGPYDKLTIERATRYYIRPKCSNIDPAQEKELRHALMATREDLFRMTDHFIYEDETHRHLLILADSGTGKTSFVLNYYAYNTGRKKGRKANLVLVPLGSKDADDLIYLVPNKESTVIFLDALDEDTKAISNHRERLHELMEKCRGFKKVVITCRTQFFPSGEEEPTETGILKLEPRRAGEKGSYEFWKLYLSPFDDNDVKTYISKRYPFWMFSQKNKALAIALKIPLLAVRPMLLAHIPEIVASNEEITYTYQLYEIMITAWIEREDYWVNKVELRNFSEKLAVDLYSNSKQRGTEGILYPELEILAKKWGFNLQGWQLGGRSLLNRDAQNNFKFAHRSIMEYLVANTMIFNQTPITFQFTDQMLSFFKEFVLGIYPKQMTDSPLDILIDEVGVIRVVQVDDSNFNEFYSMYRQDVMDFNAGENLNIFVNKLEKIATMVESSMMYSMVKDEGMMLLMYSCWLELLKRTNQMLKKSTSKAYIYEYSSEPSKSFLPFQMSVNSKFLGILPATTNNKCLYLVFFTNFNGKSRS